MLLGAKEDLFLYFSVDPNLGCDHIIQLDIGCGLESGVVIKLLSISRNKKLVGFGYQYRIISFAVIRILNARAKILKAESPIRHSYEI